MVYGWLGAPVQGVAARATVLSDNNPHARGPAENVRLESDTLTFDSICQGGNAARGAATYALSTDRFHGRIAMKMGGKKADASAPASTRAPRP